MSLYTLVRGTREGRSVSVSDWVRKILRASMIVEQTVPRYENAAYLTGLSICHKPES